jgi:hypothetical protein
MREGAAEKATRNEAKAPTVRRHATAGARDPGRLRGEWFHGCRHDGGGFKVVTIARLVRNGFVSASPQRMRAGGETMEVTQVHITDAGRWALTGLLDRGAT